MAININISQEELDNLTYSHFLSQFTIYPSYKEARMKGFEAHHIIPISIQMKEHNFSGTRKEFEKSDLLDNRCIRCTPFEHLIAHYLLAKENGFDAYLAFVSTYYINSSKINENQKITVDSLKYFNEMICFGKNKIGEMNIERHKNFSEQDKEEYRRYHKEIVNRPGVKDKIRNSVKSFWNNMSEEQYNDWYLKYIEAVKTSEYIEKQRLSGKARFEKMSNEEKEEYKQFHKKIWLNLPESQKLEIKEKHRKVWQNYTEEQKQEISNNAKIRYSMLSEDEKAAHRQRAIDAYNRLSEEEKICVCKKMKEVTNRPEVRQKMSKSRISYFNNMTKEEKEAYSKKFKEINDSESHQLYLKNIKTEYYKMKNDCIINNTIPMTWNEFQKFYNKGRVK